MVAASEANASLPPQIKVCEMKEARAAAFSALCEKWPVRFEEGPLSCNQLGRKEEPALVFVFA